MDRKPIGTLPAATERDDEAYLDFVEGLRLFDSQQLDPALRQRATQALDEYARQTGHHVRSVDEAHAALDGLPIVKSKWRVRRTSQEMFWNGIAETYKKRERELLAELDTADRSGPGSVQWDPNFRLPEYYSKVEFHIQPGGYHANPLAGYIYHYGTKVFFQGANDNDEFHRNMVFGLPLPADGRVSRVLDLATSVGQSATALKERFPTAEVWGIDAGAPMVRYAHKRAVDMGLDVHFAQRMAENMGFPDNHFDLVFAHILFHEVPVSIARQIIADVHRSLRPGGLFIIVDFMNTKDNPSPLWLHSRSIDQADNAEPYSGEFVRSDFTGMLSTVFSKVDDGHGQGKFLPTRVCVK
jgi:ubiquinone/menaquinone biosynthesis C-methylase UbiE